MRALIHIWAKQGFLRYLYKMAHICIWASLYVYGTVHIYMGKLFVLDEHVDFSNQINETKGMIDHGV